MNPNFCIIRSIFNVSLSCFPKRGQLLWVEFIKRSKMSLSYINTTQKKLQDIGTKNLLPRLESGTAFYLATIVGSKTYKR